jgi:hypothetical protein
LIPLSADIPAPLSTTSFGFIQRIKWPVPEIRQKA